MLSPVVSVRHLISFLYLLSTPHKVLSGTSFFVFLCGTTIKTCLQGFFEAVVTIISTSNFCPVLSSINFYYTIHPSTLPCLLNHTKKGTSAPYLTLLPLTPSRILTFLSLSYFPSHLLLFFQITSIPTFLVIFAASSSLFFLSFLHPFL